ncbi:hypothetical protein [Pseudobutyrivibrio sp.]|jgi:hypothetical protein|uniref:hypothetical protein n=1 Tax=Pseudobutyrivibrio sp. TaxID=2014367 RepID=UPI0026009734|nr:hypothetical protein [Pseudobutyrivibrio sp.]
MKKIVKNPLVILAVGMLVVAASSVGATRAAITYSSQSEQVDFSTAKLQVELQEKQGDDYVAVNSADSLTFPSIAEAMKTNDSDKSNDIPFTVGKKYDENVRVVNTSEGGYDEYVRVYVYKYWQDGKNKDTFLDPELINLEVADGWYEDKTEETLERKVYYLAKPLAYNESHDLIKSVTIGNEVLTYVKTVDGDKTGVVVDEYKYNGKTFYVEIMVDAVQTHNAEDAILGAWGVHVEVDDNGVITSMNGAAVN